MYLTKSEIRDKLDKFSRKSRERISIWQDNITTGASNDIEKAVAILKII